VYIFETTSKKNLPEEIAWKQIFYELMMPKALFEVKEILLVQRGSYQTYLKIGAKTRVSFLESEREAWNPDVKLSLCK